MAGRKKRVADLTRAMRRHDCLRLERRIKGCDSLDAYVVAIGSKWVLLAVPTDGSPDGYVAVRIDDIKGLYWDPSNRFVRRSLQAQSVWPLEAPRHPIDLDHGVQQLVDSIAAHSDLVTIHPELRRTNVCYIGRPHKWGRRNLRLHEVDIEGRWKPKAQRHRTDTITRVDFGRTYEKNLAIVAGPQPHLR
ncbi:hypothetical protein FHX74_001643 [Friedmanniella endophytica]|uniref:Uncharacterized protein n=1 Tax=Microlunatus kandeliicorticis TaxID=1759536 RepID=A0A7W3P5K8_9ACTN|nr:hypothetical protein [Microlunatus kandeliicorticis]MBA8794038.1 hypothetical protein [Microlunatus kandeliicorticis]